MLSTERRKVWSSTRAAIVVLAVAVVPSACATPPPEDEPEALAAYREANDPLEPMNRAFFDVNMALDDYLLRPVAWGYREALPLTVRVMVRNFLDNLRSPVIFANDVLQLEWRRAGYTLARAIINTSFGFAGVADVATEFGFPGHGEDFGQTLAVYGVGSGPYLMLPFFGPSNPRDAVGRVADLFLTPVAYTDIPISYTFARTGAEAVSFRAENFEAIDELERTSLDYYATVRSLFWQTRKEEISNGRARDGDVSGFGTPAFRGESAEPASQAPESDGQK